ncbi:hypothetical protein Pcinc_020440 [Petrolisthes cinctipes]|uniref:Uncharacterized protein n=1 Tax=Petrolisthes cinctipes TaxID=88211 RepID=A0AAE1FI29_PETCI|nr:hypothetical protein Pcinc_020440 [Petrolisthes cinctipes]
MRDAMVSMRCSGVVRVDEWGGGMSGVVRGCGCGRMSVGKESRPPLRQDSERSTFLFDLLIRLSGAKKSVSLVRGLFLSRLGRSRDREWAEPSSVNGSPE